MKILIISQYFPPESGAAAQRVGSFARYLSEFGHDVTVICQTPNYPTGNIYKGFVNRLRQVRKEAGCRVVRAFTYPTKNTSFRRRFLNYLVFSVSAFLAGLFEPRPDLILISSPPLFSGGSALFLSLVKRVPLAVDVRDVWPGVAVESGSVNKMVFFPMRLLEKLLYWRASVITTVSEGVVDILSEENSSVKGKFKVIYNGLDSQLVSGVNNGSSRSARKNNAFTIIYSGTIGTQQPWWTLLQAAELIKENREIRFLICGEGVEREKLERKIRERNLINIEFLGLLPYNDSLDLIKKSDLGLVLLARNKYVDPALPVKIFDYCFAGIPTLASASSFLKDFIDREGIGFWVEPGDPKKLAGKILEISKLPKKELYQIGKRGIRLVNHIYNRRIQAKRLEGILKDARS